MFSDEEIEGIIDIAEGTYDAVPMVIMAILLNPDKMKRFNEQASGSVDMSDWAELMFAISNNWRFDID